MSRASRSPSLASRRALRTATNNSDSRRRNDRRAPARARRCRLAVCAWRRSALAAIRRQPARTRPTPGGERPTLLLLTSLPLMFGEDFSLERRRLAARSRRCERATKSCRSASPTRSELAKGRLLLMAQPLAQTAENLVALDDWVRGGGRVLLLADPMLEWPSERPLGDPLRPPPMFADTGLLAHWGLRLDAPDERGPAARDAWRA